MTDASKDRAEGKLDELVGRGKSALGDATDDQRLKDEGDASQAEGKAKQGLAGLKDKVDDAVKKVTGNS